MELKHVVVFVDVFSDNSKYSLFTTVFHLNKFVFKHIYSNTQYASRYLCVTTNTFTVIFQEFTNI